MVTKIVSRKSIRGLLHYNENKVNEGKAVLIMASRFGMDLDKLDFHSKLHRFQRLTLKNSRVKTNALHIMLNFDPADKLSLPVLQEITGKYMDKIGFGDQPYLVYLHKDVHHPHVHVITTNIKVDGKRISIHNIGKTLSEVARKDLEKEYRLTKAEGRDNSINISPSLNLEKALYGKLPTKKAITNIVNRVLEEYKFTSFAEYNTVLGSLGIKADRGQDSSIMFQKRGLIYSIIDKSDKPIGIPFKASSLGNKPVLDVVEAKFERNKEKRTPYQDNLKIKVDNILEKYTMITQSTFLYELKKLGVDLVLRKTEQGFLYGATFVDHKNKTVFNGSTLGKNYSAKGLSERFGNNDVLKLYLTPKNTAKRFLNVDTNDVSKPFLPPVNQTHYLSDLLGKDKDDVDMEIHPKKKKKRGRFL